MIDGLLVVARLECLADVREPFIDARLLRFHALVAPVGGQSALGNLVHSLGANLHLHPFLLGSQDGDVQAFVAVRFRHGEPVAQSLRVGLIHVGDDGKGLPALHFLLFHGRVDDDADGEKVVDALEAAILLLHLLPDGVNRLRAAFHVERESGLCEPLLYGLDEAFDVGVAALLRGAQLFANHVVGIVLAVFQREVFELRFQLVETQLVSQWRIEKRRLLADALLGLFVVRVADLPHQVHALGNHDEDDAHVLGKREQQVAEILAFHHGRFHVQLADARQSVENGVHLHALVELQSLAQDDGHDAVAAQAGFLEGQLRRLQRTDDGIQPEHVALKLPRAHLLLEQLPERALVVGPERVAQVLAQRGDQISGEDSFLWGETYVLITHFLKF